MKTYTKPEIQSIKMERICLSTNSTRGEGVQYGKKDKQDDGYLPVTGGNVASPWDAK